MTSDPVIRAHYLKGLEDYKRLLREPGVDGAYRYLCETFDVLQIGCTKGKAFLDRDTRVEVSLEVFKSCLVGEPE